MFVFSRLALLITCLFICYSSTACSETEECISENSWQLGLAVGLGIKTNPLVGGDNIPLLVLPDIAWYGEKAYFDNLELGYQWINNGAISSESFIQIDSEAAFFNFLHPDNIFTSNTISGSDEYLDTPSEDENTNKVLSINDVADRYWAVNGGGRLHYFVVNSEFSIAAMTDVSGVHKGHQFEVVYQYKWQWHTARFNTKLGVNWKSTDLVDYYYGVDERDTDQKDLFYEVKGGWQPHLSVNVQIPFDEHLMWLVNLGYRKLPDTIYRSPLIQSNHIKRVFLGVAYRY
ncbi:MipA/OmpV family protein [uncultured Paraglaciecola sp.]|uniref:MipA/OmpV family protein n=1 Tax=uncultured Paraglaciecola sp. TaxID=1765024 RepID=UPI002599DCC0|nr:MipA/OmpV family protein [uncultured Paraglaciecola sp.]